MMPPSLNMKDPIISTVIFKHLKLCLSFLIDSCEDSSVWEILAFGASTVPTGLHVSPYGSLFPEL